MTFLLSSPRIKSGVTNAERRRWRFPTLFRCASLCSGSLTSSIFASPLKATKETVSRCLCVSFVSLRVGARAANATKGTNSMPSCGAFVTLRPSRAVELDPPCRAAMGRWQRGALTEGLWRYRCGPSTTRFAAVPLPRPSATGRTMSILHCRPICLIGAAEKETRP